ncbi:hypothetical protein MHAE_06874 [Mycobacterium haemophilum DSM 44634]|uniref:universal stress protein n=1 Tax=Mycobacterium haemophilum TaxID=29311 RepID=UPI0006D5BADD|nr:universal stress protein [Mycobacterium haemophilum]
MSLRQAPLGIVVGVDGSQSSTLAVEWAARDAQMRRCADAQMRNVPLRLVHVVAPVFAGESEIPLPADYAQ